MTHDYKAAKKAIEKLGHLFDLSSERWSAVIHALALADKLTGEPSDGTVDAGSDCICQAYDCYCNQTEIFKAMVKQAELEIEEEK